jgi:tetratricopeptide (TPR) repeat protein
MSSIEWVSDLFRDWSKEWKTKKGLVAYSIFIVVVVGALLLLMKELGIEVPPGWNISILGFTVMVHFVFWIWAYAIYPLYIGKIKIAFSLDIPEQDPILDELKREFWFQLDSLNLSHAVKIIELPRDKRFSDSDEAEEYSKKKDINLLVWGHMKKGQVDAQEVAEARLKFTYTYPTFSKKSLDELLKKDVKLAVVNRNWRIAIRNSIVDIDAVARNMMEISLFIIGLCLLLGRDIKRCLNVFEKLRGSLAPNVGTNDRRRAAFLQRFEQIHIQALDVLAIYLYQGNRMRELRICLERMIDINNAIPSAHINLAKLRYLEGDMDSARYHTNQADRLQANNPLCVINRAFFAVLEHKFEKAGKLYAGLTKNKDWSLACNTLEVSLFLEDEWNKHSDNIGLLFGAGFMNYHFVDKRRGKRQLKNFLKLVNRQEDKRPYSRLFALAQSAVVPRNP